jgi:hypothetical protein
MALTVLSVKDSLVVSPVPVALLNWHWALVSSSKWSA